MTTLVAIALSVMMAAATSPAPAAGKLAPPTAKEMADAIVAVNKSLGLESWPAHGVKPCLDRGGQGILAKDVTAARRSPRQRREAQPTQTRALRKRRIQGLSSPDSRFHSRGRHESWTVRKTRSGCGMRIVTRPPAAVRAVMPPAEPFGFSG